ncbi:excalibur calcium-binding domain-containing protein [Bergeriella denitrificans]|uniref:excalibur calcium-binding domain-containing protein n=1 Tax=Bergeriella denitrificans TaxID=494 RepID=UPI000E1B5D79
MPCLKQAGSLPVRGKRFCKEMSSCSEAKFYLNKCGVRRLDRDGDGIPCESIC